jgi:hypothetical protein
MFRARFVKIGGAIVSVAILILGITLPSTPWIDENKAVYISIVAIIALIVGGLMWLLGIKITKNQQTSVVSPYLKLFEVTTILSTMHDHLIKLVNEQHIRYVDTNKFNQMSEKLNEILGVKTPKTINPNQELDEMITKVKQYMRQSEKKMTKVVGDLVSEETRFKQLTNLIDSEGFGLKIEKAKDRKYLKYKKQIEKYYLTNKTLMDTTLQSLISLHINLSEFLANGLLVLKEVDGISEQTHIPKIKEMSPPKTQANIEGLENKSNDPLKEIRTLISEYIREMENDDRKE